MKQLGRSFTAVFLSCLMAMPSSAAAFEVSGWVPYWSGSRGTRDAQKHLENVDVLYLFAYSVESSGTLKDLAKLSSRSWKRLIKQARDADVAVIPTVMTSNGSMLHDILSNAKNRASHVKAIKDMVKKRSFDGVDIDYEGKLVSTNPYYSEFLEDLKDALGDKILSCTIEARTPPDSLYRTVPTNLRYANDFDRINEHCDRVNIMTYDQQRADLTLNDARKGTPYIPVADVEWVEKVMKLTMKSIDKDKLSIGVATYGAEWDLSVAPEWYKEYRKLWSLNPSYAEDLADDLDITPVRNSAGELSFTYLPEGVSIPSKYKAPRGTPEAYEAAGRALQYATETGQNTIVNVVSWSDAEAIAEKIELAEDLGLRGIAIFKIDGGEDQGLWRKLP